jgi:hypothetical protein
MQETVEVSTLPGDDISHCIERAADLRDSTLQYDIPGDLGVLLLALLLQDHS